MAASKKTKTASTSKVSENVPTNITELLGNMQTNLAQANQVIQQSIAQSELLMRHLADTKTGDQVVAAEPGQDGQATDQSSVPVNAVQAAVDKLSEHEQSVFGQLTSNAKQFLDSAGNSLQSNTGQPGFLGQVSSALQNAEHHTGSELEHLQNAAHEHIVKAEEAMKQSLQNITQSIENQRHAFEEQSNQVQAQSAQNIPPNQPGDLADTDATNGTSE